MELLTLYKIAEIATFNKGEKIDKPYLQYYVGHIKLFSESRIVAISRRSLMHIIEKGDIGIMLVLNLQSILTSSKIYVKNFKNPNRYFIFNKIEDKIVALILEIDKDPYLIVTAMVINEDYITKHFPGISIQ